MITTHAELLKVFKKELGNSEDAAIQAVYERGRADGKATPGHWKEVHPGIKQWVSDA